MSDAEGEPEQLDPPVDLLDDLLASRTRSRRDW
jgi:hypothetical protein